MNFLNDDTCIKLGELLGNMERLSGVKPTTGMLNNIMNLPVMWITQFQLEIMREKKYSAEVDDAIKAVFADLPVENAKARMNGDGQGQFMIGYMRTRGAGLNRDWAALRKAAGLSQGEAARLAGITQTALCRIESGQNKPRKKTAERLAEIYAVDKIVAE